MDAEHLQDEIGRMDSCDGHIGPILNKRRSDPVRASTSIQLCHKMQRRSSCSVETDNEIAMMDSYNGQMGPMLDKRRSDPVRASTSIQSCHKMQRRSSCSVETDNENAMMDSYNGQMGPMLDKRPLCDGDDEVKMDSVKLRTRRCKTNKREVSNPLIAKASAAELSKSLVVRKNARAPDGSSSPATAYACYKLPVPTREIAIKRQECRSVRGTLEEILSMVPSGPQGERAGTRVPSSAITRTTSASQRMITRTASAEMAVDFFALGL